MVAAFMAVEGLWCWVAIAAYRLSQRDERWSLTTHDL
jgi:hypothetical protein